MYVFSNHLLVWFAERDGKNTLTSDDATGEIAAQYSATNRKLQIKGGGVRAAWRIWIYKYIYPYISMLRIGAFESFRSRGGGFAVAPLIKQ